jgi:hypothetical protein
MMLKFIEFLNRKTGLANDSAQSAGCHGTPRMIRDNSSKPPDGMIPDFMTSLGVPVEDKTSISQFADNVNRSKGWQPCQAAELTGILVSSLKNREVFFFDFFFWKIIAGSRSLCSTIESMILRATSSAISIVSATVRPCAIRPCNTGLVAKNPPSFNSSTVMGMIYSDIFFILNESIAYFSKRGQGSVKRVLYYNRVVPEGYRIKGSNLPLTSRPYSGNLFLTYGSPS